MSAEDYAKMKRDLDWERVEHDKARTEWLLLRDRLNGLHNAVARAVDHTRPPADYQEPMCHYGGENDIIGAPWAWLAILIAEALDNFPPFDDDQEELWATRPTGR